MFKLTKLLQSLNASLPIEVNPVVWLKSRLTFAFSLPLSAVAIVDIVSLVIAPVTAMLYSPGSRLVINSATLSAVVVIEGLLFSPEVPALAVFVICPLSSSEPPLEPSEQEGNVNARLRAIMQTKIQWGGEVNVKFHFVSLKNRILLYVYNYNEFI